MDRVVPGEKVLAPRSGGGDGFEPVWVVGPVFQRLEVGFNIGVIVALSG
jgi:hypothetical protein